MRYIKQFESSSDNVTATIVTISSNVKFSMSLMILSFFLFIYDSIISSTNICNKGYKISIIRKKESIE